MLNRISSENGWLTGGGEMGERIRTLDWSKTPVGPIEQWPQNLKTAVSICISSRFPIFIWWGREQLTQFYNDAYIPMLGTAKHPRWLGGCARNCWKEIWDVINPMVEYVFERGEATWSEDLLLFLDRHLQREECYFTFSYSPIRDDAGQVVGLFAAVSETTSRVLVERRFKVLRDVSDQTADAQSVMGVAAQLGQTLAKHSLDLPFALLYLIEEGHARLVESVGVVPGTAASPSVVDLETVTPSEWPLAEVVRSGRMMQLDDLNQRFSSLGCGPYSEAPRSALLLPISAPGSAKPIAVIVAGVSSRRVLDDTYRSFYDMLAVAVTHALSNARAYEEERRRAEVLAELDRAKTAFFSNVSHEFRTPLTLMLGPLEELRSQFGTTESRLTTSEFQQVTMIHRNGLRLLKLVNTLLDFARIEAGRIDARFEPVDLATFTCELASIFRSAIEKAGLRFVVNCPPLPEPVYVDRQMWEKVVLNLLNNAFKFTFEGEIHVKLRWCGERVELLVRDTGIGIAQDELPRVFERFHRVPHARARTHEGTGIGLALVQELARLHGGDARVQSMAGVGSTFFVSIQTGTTHLPPEKIGGNRTLNSTTMPASSFVEEALRWLPDSEEDGQGCLPLSLPTKSVSARILLADDNADMREYLRRLLAQEGYDVLAVPDGEAAISAARQRRPDLVLSDVMMPKLDGFALLKQLRADVDLQSIPVILLSARAGEESRVEGLKRGADDYLIKPFSSRELLARIESNLKLVRVRHDSAEAARRRTAQFQTLFNAAPMGIYLVDQSFRLIEVNPVALPVFGDIPDLVGRHFDEVIRILWPKDYAEKIIQLFRHTLETGEPYSTPEQIHERRDRNVVEYYEWQINRIPLPEGRFGVVCYFRDISARVLAREKLNESQKDKERQRRLYNTILANTPDLAYVFDLNHRFTYANDGLLRMWGKTYEEAIGKNCLELGYEPWHAELHGREIDQIVATKQPIRGEVPFTGTFGRRIYDYILVPVLNANGEVEAVAGTTRDVTDRKAIEEALRESEERFRLMADNISQLAWISDRLGRRAWYNRRFYEYTGLTPEEMDLLDRKTIVHPDHFERVMKSIERSAETGELWEDTFPLRGKDGSYRWFLSRGVPIRDAQGKVIRWFGTNTDVTELREVQAKLAIANAQLASRAKQLDALVEKRTAKLKETLDELEVFSYSITHDMRAPLRAMQCFSTLLAEECGPNVGPDGKDYLRRIGSSANRMDHLIQDVLSYSRVARSELNMETVNLDELIKGILESYPNLNSSRVNIHVDPLPLARGNEAALTQCFSNLLGNAVKFVPRGAIPTIRVWGEKQSDKVIVFVQDNGIGIEKEYQQKIFGIFQRLNLEYEGTGIGLAIVKKAAERMGGKVGLDSEVGKGSTFWLELQGASSRLSKKLNIRKQ